MIDAFLIRAGLAALLVAITAAPLGCFMLWRRMVFFGDATAHSAILGVVIAVVLQISVTWGVLAIALALAAFLLGFEGAKSTSDSLLGVFSHSALAMGIVAASLLQLRVDLDALLFGDILTVTTGDIVVIAIGALLVLCVLAWRWRRMLLTTLAPELAISENIIPRVEQAVLLFALSLTIALSIKIVGALLVTALLIVPAASARPLAQSPEAMAIWAMVLGGGAAIGGVATSAWFDTPTGPTIICVAATIFMITTLASRLR